jgi:hypothetical protein
MSVCLPLNHLLIIFAVFSGLSVWYIHNDKKKHVNEPNYKYNNAVIDEILNAIHDKQKYLNQRDKAVLYNDLIAPERRQPEHAYPDRLIKSQLNIPTRGIPDNYQLLGVLLRDNTESAFNLFGRQKYPGSNQYEYYVQGTMSDTNIKLPIKIKGDKEIEDGQSVIVPGTNTAKGDYKVKLYDYDTPRYIPII